MALDLTNLGGPIHLSRSRINTDTEDFGTFTASSMQALLGRIVDGDPFSYWPSATGSDVTDEVFEFTFQDKTAKVAKPIDFLAFQNINWKKFKVEWKAGAGAFAIIPEFNFLGTPNTKADLPLEIASITPDTLKITVSTTFATNDFKKFGGIYACLNTFQLIQGGIIKNDQKFRETVRELKLGDNSISREYILRSAASYEHWGAAFAYQLASVAERDFMRQIKRSGDPFTFFPEPGQINRDIFTVQFNGPWKQRYESTFKGNGYRIPFTLEELGSL